MGSHISLSERTSATTRSGLVPTLMVNVYVAVNNIIRPASLFGRLSAAPVRSWRTDPILFCGGDSDEVTYSRLAKLEKCLRNCCADSHAPESHRQPAYGGTIDFWTQEVAPASDEGCSGNHNKKYPDDCSRSAGTSSSVHRHGSGVCAGAE